LGDQQVINYFKEDQLPVPKFQNLSDGFMVIVYSDKVIGNVTKDVTLNVTKESK